MDSRIPELGSYRKNPQMEVVTDSAKRRYLDSHKWALHTDDDLGRTFPVRIADEFDTAYPATLEDLHDSLKGAPLLDGVPRIDSLTDDFGVRVVDSLPHYPENIHKGMFSGYSPLLEGTVDYPDGFASPDSFAKYYDSLELGYVPKEWADHDIYASYDMFKALKDKADAGVIPGNRFWDINYDPEVYRSILPDTKGPLQDFFAKKFKLNRFSTTPTATPTEVFSNPMFEEDWWL